MSQTSNPRLDFALVCAAIVVIGTVATPATSPAQTRLDRSTIGAGATHSSSSTFVLRGTAGQQATGQGSSGSRVAKSGFWYTLSGVFPLVVFADMRVFLEGPYQGSQSMHTLANGITPPSQPFGDVRFAATPLFYEGDEVADSLHADVVDWVVVELRSDTSAASQVATRAALLMADGFVRDIDGVSNVRFDDVPQGAYYVVVRHGNHLPVMTAAAVPLDRQPDAYDFSADAAAAYGSNPMKEMESGVYALYGADANLDGLVTTTDLNEYVVSTTSGITGYVSADFNRDGQVTAPDFNIFLANSSAGVISSVPDGTGRATAKTADAPEVSPVKNTGRFPWEK